MESILFRFEPPGVLGRAAQSETTSKYRLPNFFTSLGLVMKSQIITIIEKRQVSIMEYILFPCTIIAMQVLSLEFSYLQGTPWIFIY